MTSLSTGTNSGTQTTTQSPQASVGSTGNTERAGNLQPGTSTSLLNNDKGGVPLKNQQLSVVNLNGTQAKTVVSQPPAKHQTAPVLYGISGLLFVAAIVLFWLTAKAEKSTT